MRTITREEHFATPQFIQGAEQYLAGFTSLVNQLCDRDGGRLAEMDGAGIDMQVLSLTAPGVEQLEASEAGELACATNGRVAEAVRQHPTRSAAFAALPTQSPPQAADELTRRIGEDGFKGAAINGHTRGRYLDDEFFWPILQRAETLNVPIYLHPTPPPQALIAAAYVGNYSAEVTARLATGGWGWHIDTATHLLRLILSGASDQSATICARMSLLTPGVAETVGLARLILPQLEQICTKIRCKSETAPE